MIYSDNWGRLLSVAASQAAHQVVVLDSCLGLLDARIAAAEAVTQRQLHIALVEVAHAVVHIVALGDVALRHLVLVQDRISAQAHRQAVILQE